MAEESSSAGEDSRLGEGGAGAAEGDLQPLPPGWRYPSALYREKLRVGELRPDPDQQAIMPALDALVRELSREVRRAPWRGVTVWQYADAEPPPRGLYMFGTVGRGKSMLMQLVFDGSDFPEKRRVHFHPFMEELHDRMHSAKPGPGVDRVLQIASDIAAGARLLCFDEFYVTNIGDAILLGRTMQALFRCGVTVCTTSNWAADDLFHDGLNRDSFLPLLRILKRHVHELDLAQGADWRRQHTDPVSDLGGDAEALFLELSLQPPTPGEWHFNRVSVNCLGAEAGVFWFAFEDLCHRALGPAEYMDLSRQARAVIVSGVPKLGGDNADAAMRFVVMVDLLYEGRIPFRLFSDLELDAICPSGPAAFAFQRTVSRIHELTRIFPT
ncbi:MAG: cell division protein ZapE [Magnetococcales bacterium]|nr:cell division protein ZapE [Magnetococcales bacterium]